MIDLLIPPPVKRAALDAPPHRPPPVCHHFPQVIRDALVRASQTPIVHELDRIKAIDEVAQRARRSYPQLFRRDA